MGLSRGGSILTPLTPAGLQAALAHQALDCQQQAVWAVVVIGGAVVGELAPVGLPVDPAVPFDPAGLEQAKDAAEARELVTAIPRHGPQGEVVQAALVVHDFFGVSLHGLLITNGFNVNRYRYISWIPINGAVWFFLAFYQQTPVSQ